MKHRAVAALLMVVASVFPPVGPAAQVFNPTTPVVPPPILPPTPPQAVPHLQPLPPPVANDSASHPERANPSIQPGSPARETHNDRAIRCAHQGHALGVPAGEMGQYVRECVNQ